MPIWLGILAGVLSNHMQQQEQRRQAAADMQMQFARSLDPHLPTYGYQAAKFNSQQDANSGAQVAQLLPMLLGQRDSINHGPDTTSGLQYDPAAFNQLVGQYNQRGYDGINWGARSGGIFG